MNPLSAVTQKVVWLMSLPAREGLNSSLLSVFNWMKPTPGTDAPACFTWPWSTGPFQSLTSSLSLLSWLLPAGRCSSGLCFSSSQLPQAVLCPCSLVINVKDFSAALFFLSRAAMFTMRTANFSASNMWIITVSTHHCQWAQLLGGYNTLLFHSPSSSARLASFKQINSFKLLLLITETMQAKSHWFH